jgi:hypothetical protein
MVENLRHKIKAILLECPLASGNHADEIEIFSNRLAQLALARDVVNRPRGTQRAVEKYLSELRSSCRKVIRQLQVMPREASLAMNFRKGDPNRILPILFEIVWRAEDAIAKKPARKPTRSKSNRGRARDYHAMYVTACCGRAWHTLTGKAPTPGHSDRGGERSPFEQFLGKVFRASDIKASSEHYARQMRSSDWLGIFEQDVEEELRLTRLPAPMAS